MTQFLKHTLSKPGNVLSITLGALILGILVAVPTMYASRSTAAAPTSAQLGVELYQIGLDPEALAVAGVQPAQVATLVAEAEAELTSRFDALTLARQDHAAAQQQVAQLRRAIRAGVADQGAVAQLAAAQSNAGDAQAALDAIHAAVFEAATGHLDQAVNAKLHTVAANRRWNLPIQYAVRNRTESQWVALRQALANVRINTQSGENPDSSCSTLISEENAGADVSQAATFLSTRLSGIQAAFNNQINN